MRIFEPNAVYKRWDWEGGKYVEYKGSELIDNFYRKIRKIDGRHQVLSVQKIIQPKVLEEEISTGEAVDSVLVVVNGAFIDWRSLRGNLFALGFQDLWKFIPEGLAVERISDIGKYEPCTI
jgi:hypothetical protein